jgi:hypothetical protein
MAEKVAKLGVKREKDFMYYIKGGAVWKVPRKQPGQAKGKSEKVHDAGVNQDVNYIYFLDKDGDVARAKRAIGGQKRKKTAAKAAKKATRKPAKKAAAKKPAKKAAAKKPAKGKKGKKR